MSCDWNIKCVTCNETLYFCDANHASALMGTLIQHRDAIAALVLLVSDSSGDVELRTRYGSVDPMWFARHAGHELRPVDEYGQLDNQCHGYDTCRCCSARAPCKLEINHEGDCNAWPS